MAFFYLLSYLMVALLIGLIGRKLPLGFVGFFLVSFFLTPLLGLLLLILSIPSQRAQH